MKENKNSSKISDDHPTLSSSQRKIIIKMTAKRILKALKIIQRAVKRWIYRRLAKNRTYIVDVFYEADQDIAEDIYLVGEYSNPKWTVTTPMKYSFFHRAFATKIKMHDGWQFKFIINGTFVCCNNYPMIYTREKFINNWFVIKLNKPVKVQRLRLSNVPKSFIDFNGSSIQIDRRREHYIRKKNSKIIHHLTNNGFGKSNLIQSNSLRKYEYFSPDMTLSRRSILNNNLVLTKFSSGGDFDHYNNEDNNSGDNKYFLSIAHQHKTDKSIPKLDDTVDTSWLFPSSKRIKHIMTKNVKTPLQMIHDPLNARTFVDDNNSNREDYSDFSDDDLYFLDEYLINTPFEVKNDSPGMMQIIKNSDSDCSYLYQDWSPQSWKIFEFEERFEFVAEKVKISKSASKPWGDSSFVTRHGMGIADGVGGWSQYGIDPSKFSESIMENCRKIIERKTENIMLLMNNCPNHHLACYNRSPRVRSGFIRPNQDQLNYDGYKEKTDSDDHTCSSKDHYEMIKAFGQPVRKQGIKRIRSSFHLDAHNLKEWETENQEESPKSDSTSKDKLSMSSDIKLEPRLIIKEAYKNVKDFGSSTVLVWTLHNKTLKIANIGDSTWMLIRYIPGDKSHIILKTEEQQHNFNAPYQLANLPSNIDSLKPVSYKIKLIMAPILFIHLYSFSRTIISLYTSPKYLWKILMKIIYRTKGKIVPKIKIMRKGNFGKIKLQILYFISAM